MNDCERFEEQLSALLDGELSAEEEAEARAHLAECPQCAAMYEAFAAVGTALDGEDVPDTLHDGIMAKVRAAEKAGRTQHTVVSLRSILAAAACLVVLVGTVFALKNTLGMSRKSAADAPMAAEVTAGSADEASAPEDAPFLMESKMAVAAAPKDAQPEEKMEEPRAAADSDTATNATIATDAAAPESTADALWFVIRVEAQTEEGLTGVVTDAGDQALFAEGERVAVLTDGMDAGEQQPDVTLRVIFSPDEQSDDSGIRPLALFPTE